MSYLTRLLFAFVSVLSVSALVNWFVDPYALYWSPALEGINAKKIESSERGRQTKSYRIEQLQPAIIIVGNSRVEIGLDDGYAGFAGQGVYNYASPGIGLLHQFNRAYTQLQNNPNLTTLYLSLDFLDFLSRAQTDSSAELEVLSEDFNPLQFLLSLNTLADSASTLIGQNSRQNHINPQGTHIAESYLEIVHHEGLKVLFKQKLSEVAQRLDSPLYLFDDKGKSHYLKLLQELIDEAASKHVELKLFINPYHVSYLHVISEAGYFDLFLRWKQMLAELDIPLGNMAILDFSGFNHYTNETVNLQEPHNAMRWFWEPAHYRPSLGALMLDALNKVDSDEGVSRALNKASITDIIEQDKTGLTTSLPEWQKLKAGLQLD